MSIFQYVKSYISNLKDKGEKFLHLWKATMLTTVPPEHKQNTSLKRTRKPRTGKDVSFTLYCLICQVFTISTRSFQLSRIKQTNVYFIFIQSLKIFVFLSNLLATNLTCRGETTIEIVTGHHICLPYSNCNGLLNINYS